MNLWYAHMNIDGSFHVKRFFDKKDMQECMDSDFVAHTYGPFKAENREDAIKRSSKIMGLVLS